MRDPLPNLAILLAGDCFVHLITLARGWTERERGAFCGSVMGVQHLNQRPIAPYSSEHYRRHRQQLVEKGTVKKQHADSTKEKIWGVMMKWTR
jgi:hypothetical protein